MIGKIQYLILIILTIFIGDFNARNTFWCGSDIINREGLDLNELSSHHNLHQLINTPTHILPTSEFCIDLFFTSQPNLISESGVHASLFPRFHHQIIYAKIYLKIYYPPSYENLVWDYSKANITNIRKSLSQINWVNDLRDLNVNDQVDYLTNCISNVFTNFVPNKIIACKDKHPPWMTEEVNNLCHNKAKIYEKSAKSGRSDVDKQELASITKLSSDAIIKAKKKYLSTLGDKLNDQQTGVKSYWSILNKFLQKENILLIPPMFLMRHSSQRYVRKLLYLAHSLRINVLLLIIIAHYPCLSIKSKVILIIFHLLKMK